MRLPNKKTPTVTSTTNHNQNRNSTKTRRKSSFAQFENAFPEEGESQKLDLSNDNFNNNYNPNWGWDTLQPSTSTHANVRANGNGNVRKAKTVVEDQYNNITSPSSLQTFDFPRKVKKTISRPTATTADNIYTTRKHSSGTTGTGTTELINPQQVNRIGENVPFRNRFANAAMNLQHNQNQNHAFSQHNRNHYNDDDDETPAQLIFQKENHYENENHLDHPIPSQLFLNDTSLVSTSSSNHHQDQVNTSAITNQTEWSFSNSSPRRRNHHHEDDDDNIHHSYNETSFDNGNISVFSDITGLSSIPSPHRPSTSRYNNNHHHSNRKRVNGKLKRISPSKVSSDSFQEEEKNCVEKQLNGTSTTFSSSIYMTDDDDDNNDDMNNLDWKENVNHDNAAKNQKEKYSRLISLFTSRAINHDKNNQNHQNAATTDATNYNLKNTPTKQQHPTRSNDKMKRSKSAPKERFQNRKKNNLTPTSTNTNVAAPPSSAVKDEKHITPLQSSPDASSSVSSANYVGWPGTINKDGTTVAISNCSLSDIGGDDKGTNGNGVESGTGIGKDFEKNWINGNNDRRRMSNGKIGPVEEKKKKQYSENLKNHQNSNDNEKRIGSGRKNVEQSSPQQQQRKSFLFDNKKKSNSNSNHQKSQSVGGGIFRRNSLVKNKKNSEIKNKFEGQHHHATGGVLDEEEKEEEEEIVDLDVVPSSDSEDERQLQQQLLQKPQYSANKQLQQQGGRKSPADFYLASIVKTAKSPTPSPSASPITVPDSKNLNEMNKTTTSASSLTYQQTNEGHNASKTSDELASTLQTRSIRHRERRSRSRPNNNDGHQSKQSNYNRSDGDKTNNNNENHKKDKSLQLIDTSHSLRRVRSTGRNTNRNIRSSDALGSISETQGVAIRLSEEALKNNERFSPARNIGHGANVAGFLGFLDKTKDVPNLIDDSDSVTTVSTMATERNSAPVAQNHGPAIRHVGHQGNPPFGSDVFDDLSGNHDSGSDVFSGISSSVTGHSFIRHGRLSKRHMSPTQQRNGRLILEHKLPLNSNQSKDNDVNIVDINRTLTTVQTSVEDFERRTTSKEFDSMLSESDTDFFSGAEDNRIPKHVIPSPEDNNKSSWPGHNLTRGFHSILSDTRSETSGGGSFTSSSSFRSSVISNNSGTSLDLSQYAVEPSQVRKLVKHYRKMSNNIAKRTNDPSVMEDSKKAFALFEMRSRIMETDIERGLDRTGGTTTVDDIALTSYYQAGYRVRDAVVVSKAWREGASPADAKTAFFLTTGKAGSFHVKRRVRSGEPDGSVISGMSYSDWSSISRQPFVWEKVLWIDDTEFSLLRCPSLGPSTLRGSDIFTLGDCQSILLRLTNDYCEELRSKLDEAIDCQLIAEHIMREEAEADNGSMTEAEDAYLEAMDEVKTVTSSLARAEKAFEMVRSKIEELVSKYENILQLMDTSGNRVVDEDSVCGGDDLSNPSSLDQDTRNKLTRRAQRAELKAEVASREAQIAKVEAEKSKQEAERIRIQKEKELEELRKRLDELEVKSSMMESDYENKLQYHKNFVEDTFKNRVGFTNDMSVEPRDAVGTQSLLYAASNVGIDQDKGDAKERLKARFRERRSLAEASINRNKSGSGTLVESTEASVQQKKKISGTVHQRLMFYERSLQAVEKK
mmetsp:Transcript_18975/g.23345  ORF Transcript_18975/g.23345 Transcript_18975/m.23345 type:complete len:1647 (-) Transcript_18975:76-5016(-)